MFFKQRPTTVDAAIAPLLQAIVDLEAIADERNENLVRVGTLIGTLETLMQTDQIELTRAEAVAKMIKAITSPALDSPAKDAPPEA